MYEFLPPPSVSLALVTGIIADKLTFIYLFTIHTYIFSITIYNSLFTLLHQKLKLCCASAFHSIFLSNRLLHVPSKSTVYPNIAIYLCIFIQDLSIISEFRRFLRH